MKAAVLAGFLLVSVFSFGQDAEAERISTAFSNGNAKAIASYFLPTVDYAILDDEDMLPADQVAQKLAKFFSAAGVKDFKVKHKGKSKLDDHYRIGDLVTSKGTYRVTYFLKKGKQGMKIKQLRIEEYD
mmetsp:Transcript_13547/g.20507  ORF Transcript_13547/g.20507 Transcript_13547/m.20507 type:complete len:129 (-) Transcript_13547:12-398(-)